MKFIRIKREQVNYVEVDISLEDFDLKEMWLRRNTMLDSPLVSTYETLEDYIESLINGDIQTIKEQEFIDHYNDLESEAYGMPNQDVDTSIEWFQSEKTL